MSLSGWIVLQRSLLEWEWYSDANTMRLFMHCLLKANFEKKKWQGQTIERGQFITSYPNLAAELGLSVKQIRGSLDKLKATGEVAVKATNKFSLISITNYKKYQDKGSQEGSQKLGQNGSQGAVEGHSKGSNVTTKQLNNKNIHVEGEPSTGDGELFEKDQTDQQKNNVTEFPKSKTPTCPHTEIVELYHELLPECKRVIPSMWQGSDRAKNLTARWRESEKHRDLDFWAWLLTGIRDLRDGFYISDVGGPWRADIGWIIQKKNFINLCEQIASKRAAQ